MICDVALKKFAALAKREISKGTPEDVLRHLFSASLTAIFPDSPWWVKVHILGTETHVTFASQTGRKRSGFADSMVGKTAIEYEKNLGAKAIFDEGYYQVREYCAALCNQGIPSKDVLGVLSDTVHWYGYSIRLTKLTKSGYLLGAEDVELIEQDVVDLSVCSDVECLTFGKFVDKYFARAKSRILNPITLADDFGVNSDMFAGVRGAFVSAVKTAAKQRPCYYKLIKNVWQNFIAYLGASDFGRFSEDTYVNELYLITLAKVLCANILQGDSICSTEAEALEILNGDYFKRQNLENLVDYDYFGWLNESPFAELLVSAVLEMQRGMQAYDFQMIKVEDIFGRLLAQLADKEHRLLLGQEFTPRWVAHSVVEHILDALPKSLFPRMIDMCCGSGVFLIEGINSVRARYGILNGRCSQKRLQELSSCVLGFDIDPLAVMLAKVNWVLAMRDIFTSLNEAVIIPIYHADSLFVATPVSHMMPDGTEKEYVLRFDNDVVTLPHFLLSSEMRKVFDCALTNIHKLAMARAKKLKCEALKDVSVAKVLDAVERDASIKFSEQQANLLMGSFRQLIMTLEKLQRQGRNGIWSFVLSNSYRPGLTSRQFNCVVSNPPWLAMSRFADNPYRSVLTRKAEMYGIKPRGQSHLHLELATTFLIAAVDRYLLPDAHWGCVMPGTVVNGDNHEPLRREAYRSATQPVPMRTTEVWDLPVQTFKNRAVVMFGEKSSVANPSIIMGRKYEDSDRYSDVQWKRVDQGGRSAWVTDTDSVAATVDQQDSYFFVEGADVMPRSALFHRFKKQPNGRYEISPIEKNGDLYYLLGDCKKMCCADVVAKDFDAKFIYECFLSKHMSPFYVADPALVIVPGNRCADETWEPITEEDLSLLNAGTNSVLRRISRESDCNGSLEVLLKKIDIRNKLRKQSFQMKRWLVLSNAGGSNPCAAFVDLKRFDVNRIIVDQTLYWYVAESEEEARYLTGILNSKALAAAIQAFQPQGVFGRRHIHALPYRVIPKYDSNNRIHKNVVNATAKLMAECLNLYTYPRFSRCVRPDGGQLNVRRKELQCEMRKLNSYQAFEIACAKVFAATLDYGSEKKVLESGLQLKGNSMLIAGTDPHNEYEMPRTEYLGAASQKNTYEARPK